MLIFAFFIAILAHYKIAIQLMLIHSISVKSKERIHYEYRQHINDTGTGRTISWNNCWYFKQLATLWSQHHPICAMGQSHTISQIRPRYLDWKQPSKTNTITIACYNNITYTGITMSLLYIPKYLQQKTYKIKNAALTNFTFLLYNRSNEVI